MEGRRVETENWIKYSIDYDVFVDLLTQPVVDLSIDIKTVTDTEALS